jgi:hypothetical protein
MRLPRVPGILVGGIAALPELFLASATGKPERRSEIEEIVRLLPPEIRGLECFLDRLTGLWRYDYGEPFVNLPGGGTVIGTNMFHQVDRLLEVLACARKRLAPDQIASYLQRLADPNRHEDTLVEFAPVLRLSATTEAEFEVLGYGEGSKTVDWLIRSQTLAALLEVKNRNRDLMESFARLQAGDRGPDDTTPDPTHDPALLFRSVESKFVPRSSSEIMQVGWITTRLKQEEEELLAAFEKLNASRVHAIVLGDFADDVYVLSHEPGIRERILELLQVRESRRFVFRRGEA